MFGAFRLWGLRRKLRGSLAADPFQLGWSVWLDAATSETQLRETCSHPGWLVHCAYWSGVSQDKLLEAALILAQHAIEHGPPNVFVRETVMDLRQVKFPEIAEMIVALERKYPAMIGIEAALPGQTRISLGQLYEARDKALREGNTGDGKPKEADLAKAGVAGAAAAGFSLALQTLFHRQYGLREPLTLATAAAAAFFNIAMPDHKTDLMALLRDRFGWRAVADSE